MYIGIGSGRGALLVGGLVGWGLEVHSIQLLDPDLVELLVVQLCIILIF